MRDIHFLLVAVGTVPFRSFKGTDACEADGSDLANIDSAEGIPSSVSDTADIVGVGDIYASG